MLKMVFHHSTHLLVMTLILGLIHCTSPCPNEWFDYGGKCFRRTAELNFTEAHDVCPQGLAVFGSDSELQGVLSEIRKNPSDSNLHIWVGVRGGGAGNGWRWAKNGEEMSFTPSTCYGCYNHDDFTCLWSLFPNHMQPQDCLTRINVVGICGGVAGGGASTSGGVASTASTASTELTTAVTTAYEANIKAVPTTYGSAVGTNTTLKNGLVFHFVGIGKKTSTAIEIKNGVNTVKRCGVMCVGLQGCKGFNYRDETMTCQLLKDLEGGEINERNSKWKYYRVD